MDQKWTIYSPLLVHFLKNTLKYRVFLLFWGDTEFHKKNVMFGGCPYQMCMDHVAFCGPQELLAEPWRP